MLLERLPTSLPACLPLAGSLKCLAFPVACFQNTLIEARSKSIPETLCFHTPYISLPKILSCMYLASINLHSVNLYSSNYTSQLFTHCWSIFLYMCMVSFSVTGVGSVVFSLCTPMVSPFRWHVCPAIPSIPREWGNACCLEWVWALF